jgi:hypothetical protein
MYVCMYVSNIYALLDVDVVSQYMVYNCVYYCDTYIHTYTHLF